MSYDSIKTKTPRELFKSEKLECVNCGENIETLFKLNDVFESVICDVCIDKPVEELGWSKVWEDKNV